MNLGIRGKMILLIAGPALIIYVGVLGPTLTYLARVNRGEVEQRMTERATGDADRFDGVFREAAAVARTTARFLETSGDLSEAQIYALLRANVSQNPVIFGAAAAFEPGTVRSGDDLFCPYVARRDDGLFDMNIGRDVLDWYADERWQWWHAPKRTGQPVWTDPYFDDGAGNVLMVTFSAPFERDGEFGGVTTIDIMLPRLQEQVGTSIVGDLDFILLSMDGRYVYSREESEIRSEKTAFELLTDAGRPDLAAAFRTMVEGDAGVVRVRGEADVETAAARWTEPQWIFYARIPSTGWTFAAALPERVALAGVRSRMGLGVIAITLTLLLIVVGVLITARRLLGPVAELAHAVRRIASGDLAHRVEVRSRDELGDLGRDVNKMAADLTTRTNQIAGQRSESREAMIFALAKLAESRDDDTGKHLERICRYVRILAAELARHDPTIDEAWLRTVVITAALHDIGKVGVPDAVLNKPGRLTDEEREVMQKHTTIGGDTLLAVRREWSEDDFLRIAVEIAFAHHERWDGSGYPFGLAAEDISLSARIVAVADVYDALTSKRVYKDAMPHEEARKIIVDGSGSHFDPRVVEAFLAVESDFQAIAEELR